MTQSHLDRAVAPVHRRVPPHRPPPRLRPAAAGDPGPAGEATSAWSSDCPFCGRPAPLEAAAGALPPLAECDRCDVYFDYRPAEVYAARGRPARGGRGGVSPAGPGAVARASAAPAGAALRITMTERVRRCPSILRYGVRMTLALNLKVNINR